MTMSLTAFSEIAKKSIYPVMDEEYAAVPLVYPLICEVKTDNLPVHGDKGTTMEGLGEPKERRDGEEVMADQIGEGYTWYLKVRLIARRFEITERDLEHLDQRRAASGLGDMMQKLTKGWGEAFARKCDKHVAGMFQKGTLTAGSVTYFNNSFPGETDPYPGVIYDGLPFFDTAHTQSGGSATFVNHTVSRALSTANLQSTLITMTTTNAKDERNQDIQINPNVLVIPPNLRYTAQTILRSVGLPGTANNDVNTMYQSLTPIEWRYLTDDTDAWWVGERGKGVLVYDSGNPVITTYEDPIRKVFGVVAEKRFGATVTNWRYWYNCNKAAS